MFSRERSPLDSQQIYFRGPAASVMDRPGAVVVVLVAVAVSAAVAPAPAAATVPGGEAQTTQTIVLTQEFRLTPDQPGRIDVRWEFEIPKAVSGLRPEVPADAENVRTDGFRSGAGRLYEWDGETATPSLTFTVPVNDTREVSGPEGADGDFVFVDTGDWAIARNDGIPRLGYTYRGDTEITVEQHNTTAGPGAAGGTMVFLGAHDSYTRSAHGQQFRLVVPEAADLTASRTEILDSVAAASDTLRVGDRDPRVLMIAAPTSVPWGVEGLQRGDSDFYVTADERVDTPENVWLHEYVHTRQRFNRSAETLWLTEATAQYYAARLTLRQDRVGYGEFAELLGLGTSRRYADAVLVNPTTWTTANYRVGALVVADLDRRTRLTTDGASTFQSVFRRLNERDTRVSQRAFLGFVRAAGGDTVVQPARRYTETTDRPPVPTREEFAAAFGTLPASMRYGVAGLAVRGPYRNATLADGDAVGLVTGETLDVSATAENVGGSPGPYNLTLRRDGRVVDYATGRLDPEESARVPVRTAFAEPGTHTLAVGNARLTVAVREPAALSVADLTVDRRQVAPGESVTVTATVHNGADRPGRTDLTVARDGMAVDSRVLRLAPGAERTVAVEVEVPEGRHRITVGDRSVTVTGGSADTASDSGGVAGGAAPGFGAAALLVAALLGLALAASRGR